METTQKPTHFSRKVFCEGMRDGVPIALGYFAVSFSLGIAARNAGRPPFRAFLQACSTMLLPVSMRAFSLIAAGAPIWKLRHHHPDCQRALPADELCSGPKLPQARRSSTGSSSATMSPTGWFGITIARPGYLNPFYTYGAIALAAPAWAMGTALGIIAGNIAARACGQRPECGPVRHVPGHHHSPRPEEQGRCRAGDAQLCPELCLRLPARHRFPFGRHPHHPADGAQSPAGRLFCSLLHPKHRKLPELRRCRHDLQ